MTGYVYLVPSDINYADAIKGLLLRQLPDVKFNFPEITRPTLKMAWRTECDWVREADELACAIGMRLRSDQQGVWHLDEHSPEDRAKWQWTFDEAA